MATYQSQYTGQQIDAAVAFGMSPDATPTQNSTKGVTSGGVYAETSALKSALGDILCNEYINIMSLIGTFEVGTIDTTGNNQNSTTRIRSIGYADIRDVKSISYTVEDGYKIAIAWYSDSALVRDDYWLTGTKTVSKPATATRIRLVISDANDVAADISWVSKVILNANYALMQKTEDIDNVKNTLLGNLKITNTILDNQTQEVTLTTNSEWEDLILFESFDFFAGNKYQYDLNYDKTVGSAYLVFTESDDSSWFNTQVGNASSAYGTFTPVLDHFGVKVGIRFSLAEINVKCKITNTSKSNVIDQLNFVQSEANNVINVEVADNLFVNGAYSRAGVAVSNVTAPYYLISSISIRQNVTAVKALSGYLLTVMAWDNVGDYAGFLTAKNTLTTVTTKNIYWSDAIDIAALRAAYPTYAFRVEVANKLTTEGTNTEITPSEQSNVTLISSGDKTKIQKYYESEMTNFISDVRDTLTEPALVFPLVTDIHYLSINNAFDYCINNILEFCRNVKCNFIVNLGDNTDGNTIQDTTLARNFYMLSRFNEIDLPYRQTIGNHDTNYYLSGSPYLFTSEQIFKSYLSNTHDVVFDMTIGEKNFYKDFDELGIRVIWLDADHGNSYRYSGHTASWLSNIALDTNYIVVLCEHLSSIATQNWNAQALINGDAVTAALQGFVTNGGTLIQLCGHSHADYYFTSPWLTIYSTCQKTEATDTTTAGYSAITGYEGSIVSPARKLNTATEDSWSAIVVKPLSRKIEALRFGAGNSRSFNF